MKNAIIIILALALLGFGGWFIYDKTTSDNSSETNGTINGGGASTESNPLASPANVLDFSNKGLTEVDSNIYSKTNTTQLILSNNNLRTLPSEMGKMAKLEVLKLDSNSLEGSLIGEVRMMPLKNLDVSNNKMTGMPAEIGQLNKLESLDYSNNQITGLPNELANLKNNLKTLNLSGNPLSRETINMLKTSLPNTNIIF